MASAEKFRRLDVELPHQPIKDQRPWLVAGVLLVFLILLTTLYFYFQHQKPPVLQEQSQHNKS